MSVFEGSKFSDDYKFQFARVLDSVKTGIWEYNFNTRNIKLSAGFYEILGYQPGDFAATYNFFFEHLLYHEDQAALLNAFNSQTAENADTVQIRLLTKNTGYKWFESTAKKWEVAGITYLTGLIFDIHQYKLIEADADKNEFHAGDYYRISKIGGWEINIAEMTINLSREAYNLFELQNKVPVSIEEVVSFFEPDHRSALDQAITAITRYCRPFELNLLFRSARNNTFWMRAKALPVIDDYGKCTKVLGIFQNIDEAEKKQMEIQKSVDLLSDQNKRLQNFAYIVSHNLRSHTGNLQFMVNLFEQTELTDDRQEIFGHVKSISESLTNTISHLNEIVKIQSEIGNQRKNIRFETMFNNVVSALYNNIEATHAVIDADFSKCPEIKYIPAYLESIFQNMLTNSLKYRHPDRVPVIKCYTYKKDQHSYLIFKDNGLGIDLARYGDMVFGMYKTFHQNADSKGIGLFITRNQIEALGGTIEIESTVNIGTKFTIKLT